MAWKWYLKVLLVMAFVAVAFMINLESDVDDKCRLLYGHRRLTTYFQNICVQNLLVTACNLEIAKENVIAREDNVREVFNSMIDVSSARQYIVSLEVLEIAYSLEVTAFGQLAVSAGEVVAAGLVEYVTYWNTASLEFIRARECLPGVILENVTNPKVMAQDMILLSGGDSHAGAARRFRI